MSLQKREKFSLTDKKLELLDALLREEGVVHDRDRIRPRTVEGPIPLSFAQQRLWFFDQFEPGSRAYNLVGTVSLTGALDRSALRRSFVEVVKRHDVLRTRFEFQNGRPVQIIGPPVALPLPA